MDTFESKSTQIATKLAAERAYRRGCSQVLTFILRDAVDLPPEALLPFLASWHERLKASRDSNDLRYLGKYLDVVRDELHRS